MNCQFSQCQNYLLFYMGTVPKGVVMLPLFIPELSRYTFTHNPMLLKIKTDKVSFFL